VISACSHCGGPLPADTNFCPACGHPVAADEFPTDAEDLDQTLVRRWSTDEVD
jgi:predicted amidophosphoribosyltransferase